MIYKLVFLPPVYLIAYQSISHSLFTTVFLDLKVYLSEILQWLLNVQRRKSLHFSHVKQSHSWVNPLQLFPAASSLPSLASTDFRSLTTHTLQVSYTFTSSTFLSCLTRSVLYIFQGWLKSHFPYWRKILENFSGF